MKSRSEIINELVSVLSTQESGAWSRLQNSVIGKELLAYGAEVIAASDNINDSLVQSFDYKLADERALISLSHVHDVPVSFNKPAYMRIRLLGSASTRMYRPFDLVFTVGNVKFTNIKWVSGAEDILLYQGVVKTMMTEALLTDFNIEKTIAWDKTIIPTSEDTIMTGHNIGRALPDSVYVYYADQRVSGILSSFTPLRYGPTVLSYKLYTLFNKDIVVLDGDGVWGKKDFIAPDFQIVWLEPTDNDFSTNGKLSSIEYGDIAYELRGSSQGEFDSLEYARDVFRRYYLQLNAIVSKEQIHDFITSYSYVQDCNLTCLNNKITVYVKPTDPSDSGEYGDIESVLDLKGGILTSYQLQNGEPLKFQFITTTKISTNLQSQIENELKTLYSYTNMKYTDVVDVAKISAIIQAKYGVSLRIKLGVLNASVQSGEDLQFIPEQGTIKMITNGKELGYDLNGVLYHKRDGGENYISIGDNYFGEYLYDLDYELFVKFDKGTLSSVKTDLLQLNGSTEFRSHNGYSYAYANLSQSESAPNRWAFKIYDNSVINPAGLISNLTAVSGAYPKNIVVDRDTIPFPFWYKGSFYTITTTTSDLKINFYTIDNEEPYYIISIPVVTDKIRGFFVAGSTLYIVCSANKVVVVTNFGTSTVGWSVLSAQALTPGYTLAMMHCYKEGYCALLYVSDDGSSVDLYTATGLSVANSQVQPLNAYKIDSVSRQGSKPDRFAVFCNEDYLIYYDWRNRINKFIYYDGSKYEALDSETKFHNYLLTSTDIVGTVNYNTGNIVLSSSLPGVKFSYESTNVNLTERNYLVLNEDSPIVWK